MHLQLFCVLGRFTDRRYPTTLARNAGLCLIRLPSISDIAVDRICARQFPSTVAGDLFMVVAKLPPGPKGHFLLGNIPDYRRGQLEFLERCSREYGDIVRLRL